MKKNNLTLIILILLGLFAGLIATMLLEPVQSLSVLTKSVELNWQPKADLKVITYDIQIAFKLNLLCVIGVIGGYILYRKL